MRVKLGDICEINPKRTPEDLDMNVSFIPMQRVSDQGDIDTSDIRSIKEVCKGFTAFVDGDILMAKITPCMENGKGAIASGLHNGIGYGSTEFHVLRPNQDLVRSSWIYYFTIEKLFRLNCEKNMTGSAGQKRVPKSYLQGYPIPLPSLAEQDMKIATLDRLRQIIILYKSQLQKLDELVKARFVEMFGGIHDSLKYPYKAVKYFTDVISGGTPSRDVAKYWINGTIPWVKTTELQNNVIESVEEYITQEGLSNSSAKIVPTRTILIAMYGQGKTRGMTSFLGIEACTNQACACILPSNEINQTYLWQYFILSYDNLRGMAKGGNQPNLNCNIIKNYPVLCPPLELQNKFSAFVAQIEKSKAVVQQSLDKTQQLFDSLMQEYFA